MRFTEHYGIIRRRARQCWQEAQLSQRDRAMLRAIEYFAESLKVT